MLFPTIRAAAENFAQYKSGTVEQTYRWTDDWYRARISLTDGDKTFCEITRSDSGWILKGPSKPHILYRQNELPGEGVIFVVEGEKCCDAAWSINLPSITSGSCDSSGSADWSALAGRDVLIVPDNDTPGMRYAEAVARRLYALTPPARVRIVQLPGLAEREDIFDFIKVHRDSQDSEQIKADILELAARASFFVPSSCSAETDDKWQEPQPLPDELPPVRPFEFDLLPASLRDAVADIAERMQCPPDFVAVAFMVALAAVVGRKLGIRPKRHDDWLVVPNLWGLVIGPPSVMKTPAVTEALRPLRRLEIQAKQQFEAAKAEFAAQELVDEQRAKIAKQQIRTALESDQGDPLAEARRAFSSTTEPVRRRYIANDSTVEKLGELLNQNPNGLLVYRDELIGLLKSLDKEGQEGARSFYVEAWNGAGRYTYDRIGRGTIDIEAAIISVIGCIQPGPLRAYVRSAVGDDEGADGLMQRFQLAVYPDVPKAWKNVDRRVDSKARATTDDVFARLDTLDSVAIGAEFDELDTDGIPFLRFDLSAQDHFDRWRSDLEIRLRAAAEHPAVVAHLTKYRSLVPSLALLIHLADRGSGPVGDMVLEKAIGWARYLESHARRIYSSAVTADAYEAGLLAHRILAKTLPDEIVLRDIYRKGWLGLGTREAAQRAVNMLCDLDWAIEFVEPTPGRTRRAYRVNPKIWSMPRSTSAGGSET